LLACVNGRTGHNQRDLVKIKLLRRTALAD
jgi:hypothetical protein